MRKGLFTLFLFFLILSVSAQNYPYEEQNARSFYELNYSNGLLRHDQLSVDTSFVYKNLTVVNFSTPKGFVILKSGSGNPEVVGYSYSNHFSFDVDTTGVAEEWADALSDDTNMPGYEPNRTIPKMKTGRVAVEPLVQTAWNQGMPYSYYCPFDEDENKNAIVGCVAVAVGQIIRYYDKWNDFEIQYSYEHEKYGNLSCFAGSYNWLAMENKCYGVNHEVARLLYHSGVLVDMGYGTSASGASSSRAADLFGRIYNGGHLDNTPHSGIDDFYNSISQYKPIYSTYPGHAFVCDGYDGGEFYHFNLGWGGSANGFYALTSVVGKSLTSAIFDTSPIDSLKPPQRFMKNIISDSEVEISWHGPDGDRDGLSGYSIYLDDVLFDETADTLYLHTSQPGSHYLRVTANYINGESRWIGPGSYFSHGNPISIPDSKLKAALNTSIGIPSALRNSHDPTEGELFDIKNLSVTNTVDLTGIGNCINLKQLNLFSTRSDRAIDLNEIKECPEIVALKISNYMLVNPEALSALTKMQDLKLLGNSQSDMSFLTSLKNLDQLQIDGNPLSDLAFLNDLDKLTRITLTGCGIQSFDQLENTYGLEYLDVANNELTDIEWLNGNRSLFYLNAGQNQLAGKIALEGLLKLRDIDLSENQIEALSISDAPLLISLNISENQIHSIQNILEENNEMSELDASDNIIDTLPLVRNKLLDLDLGGNLISDIVPLDIYGSLTKLDLQSNRIVDLSPLIYKSFAAQIERLNVRGNPISKESFIVHKPLISAAAGSTYFPSSYFSGSPCYLRPSGDSVVMNKTVNLNWEGDYDDEGYLYDIYLSIDEEEYSKLATELAEMSYEIELTKSGNYKWYVVAHLEEDSLFSGYSTFKIFSGFTVPFFEDFEIYTPNEKLCLQTPYWRVFGGEINPGNDAFVVNLRAYEGDNSIKIAGATDLLFPVTEYLTGYLETSFMMMIDQNRQATIKTLLSDSTSIDFFFYKAGICEVYQGQTRLKFFTFNPREWMEMEIISDQSRGLEWRLNDEEILSLESPQPIKGVRFCTLDGPGYYDPAPTVMYLDNFAIDDGTLLSAPNILSGNDLIGNFYYNGEEIVIEDINPDFQKIEIYNIKGQLKKTIRQDGFGLSSYSVPFKPEESIAIVVLYDKMNRRFSKKILLSL